MQQRIPTYLWHALDVLPEELQDHMAALGGDALELLVGHPSILPRHQEHCARWGDLDTVELLIRNPSLTVGSQIILVERLNPADSYYFAMMRLDPEAQAVAARTPTWWPTLSIQHDLPRDLAELLLKEAKDQPAVLRSLARWDGLTPEEQRMLYIRNDPGIIEALAMNPNLDPRLGDKMILRGGQCLTNYTTHTRSEDSLLEIILSSKATTQVLVAAAKNPALTDDQQIYLAGVTGRSENLPLALSQRTTLCLAAQEIIAQRANVTSVILANILMRADQLHPLVATRLEGLGHLNHALAQSSHATLQDLERLAETGRYDTYLAKRDDLPSTIEKMIFDRKNDKALYALLQSTRDPQLLRLAVQDNPDEYDARHVAWSNVVFPWSLDAPVQAALSHNPWFLENALTESGVDSETWDSLVETWRGSVKDLLEACTLI